MRQYVVLKVPEQVSLSAAYPRREKPDRSQVIVSSWPGAFTAQERAALESEEVEILTEEEAADIGVAWDADYLDAHPEIKVSPGAGV